MKIIVGVVILLAGAFMFTQSQSDAKLPSCVMTVGVVLLLVGILS